MYACAMLTTYLCPRSAPCIVTYDMAGQDSELAGLGPGEVDAMEHARKPAVDKSPDDRCVKQQLSRIYGRFQQLSDKKLLSEEYEALEHILNGFDHAVLSLFSYRWARDNIKDEIYQAMSVTVDKKSSPVFLNTYAEFDLREQAMEMFYQPPFGDAPSRNYSLVWILIKNPKKIHGLPFIPSHRQSLPANLEDMSIEPESCSEIEEDRPYHISNYIAPVAFMVVTSDSDGDIHNIIFREGKDASEIYFKRGKNPEGKIRYSLRTEKNFYLLPGDMPGVSKKPLPHKIIAKKVTNVSTTDGKLNVFVWEISDSSFRVSCGRPITKK